MEGVGSASVQGDAGFALALQRMGCDVVQTETSSTVRGPPLCVPVDGAVASAERLVGIDIDMETMTDAFLTLCAVAAVAEGVTQITGIANQRVKECNRIAAIVREFAKCGILAWEVRLPRVSLRAAVAAAVAGAPAPARSRSPSALVRPIHRPRFRPPLPSPPHARALTSCSLLFSFLLFDRILLFALDSLLPRSSTTASRCKASAGRTA